jgi:hypothetical protein
MDNTTDTARNEKMAKSTIKYYAQRGWDVRCHEANGLILIRQTHEDEDIEMMTCTLNGLIHGEHRFPSNDYGEALLDASCRAAREFIR